MNLLKQIPQLDKFIQYIAFKDFKISLLKPLAKEVLEEFRQDILKEKIDNFDENELILKVKKKYKDILKPSLVPLINATGIIIHTNLGRSLVSKEMAQKVQPLLSSYNNLEYDLEKGKRGQRYSHLKKLFSRLCACEDVLVVNNNAAAVFLILNTFAKDKDVLVSRGELVEIGGSFRIPDIMEQSGARLKELGTTNKTHFSDYEKAINENTAMLMKVHKSNFCIKGFCSEVDFEDLIPLAQKNNIIDYYDMGSAHIFDLPFGLKEPKLLDYMKKNPSLLSFSGDKLFGSIQAGIILGKKELIAKLKKNQLLRMLRVDKLSLALLEEHLRALILEDLEKIPTLKMLYTPLDKLKKRAEALKSKLKNTKILEEELLILQGQTPLGGGSNPEEKIPTFVLALKFKNQKTKILEEKLRANGVICHIEKDACLIDFRSIQENEDGILEQIIKKVLLND